MSEPFTTALPYNSLKDVIILDELWWAAMCVLG